MPLARAFAPQLVLISAGYDAHRDDPLGECELTEQGYAAMTRSMRSICRTLEAPLGCVLEGGYALGALATSVAATLAALQEPLPAESAVDGADGATSPLVGAALERLSEWWPALR